MVRPVPTERLGAPCRLARIAPSDLHVPWPGYLCCTSKSKVGLTLTQLVEHDSVPWNALPGQMTQLSNGEWRVTDRRSAAPTATPCRP